ncbi:MAG: class I SAM-dependent methyltransferase [Paracoccaceae bacterium]|nr:MAG: class I SAM-dependent methyltransferase [Paracoccaceae bacterium]
MTGLRTMARRGLAAMRAARAAFAVPPAPAAAVAAAGPARVAPAPASPAAAAAPAEPPPKPARRFGYEGDDVAGDIRGKYGFQGDLLDIYAGHRGPAINKWHHYLPIYDRHFARRRGTAVRFLEIGVARGGSLQMWRRYLGDDAVIFGIDIRPDCARLDGQAGRVRIGSQDDEVFLNAVVDEMGGVDVVLDDGSHMMPHVRKTLAVLFPRLETGGTYMIEDMHTAYWPRWGGGFGVPENVFHDLRGVIDDIHHPYHGKPEQAAGFGRSVSGLHVYDSIIVLDKDPVHPPVNSMVG